MADDKDKKIKVRFCETFSRSLGQTQDFYDDNVGDDDGLSPPWRKDVALTIEKAPEQAEMETWATNRGRGLANRTALRPIPSVGQRHLPAETSNRITRPWRSATCNERHIDASNGLQSRVITTLSSTRLEGHWEPTKPSDEDLLTEFPSEIHTLSDLMRVVAYETAEDLRNALTEAGAATYGIYGVPLPDFDAMREKVWCEMKKITYELMILKKILNEAVEDTGKAKKEADEAYEKFQPGLVSKLQKTCAEFGRIHGCRDKLRQTSSKTFRKAKFLAKEIMAAMQLLSTPIQHSAMKLHERRTAPSPAMEMSGDLGVFLVRKALSLYGRNYVRCFDFGSKVASQIKRQKTEAEFAVTALLAFLDMKYTSRNPYFDIVPRYGGLGDELVPPVTPIISGDTLRATTRATNYLKEAQALRGLLRAHAFDEEATNEIFPAFPDDDEVNVIGSWKADDGYLETELQSWAPKTVIATSILNRAIGKKRKRDSFLLPGRVRFSAAARALREKHLGPESTTEE